MSDVKQYLQELMRLHKLDNSYEVPDDLPEQYKAVRRRYAHLREATDKALHVHESLSENIVINLHDAWVENFSERRSAGGWTTRFTSHPIAYDVQGTTGQELGYCLTQFELSVRQPLRAASGCEIYNFAIDPETKELGMIVHHRKPGLPSMEVIVVNYDELKITQGPVQSWNEMYVARARLHPFVSAEIIVQREKGEERFLASWHSDGSIVVEHEGEARNYSDFASSFYGEYALGKTKSVHIESQQAGIRGEIGANSDEGYYGAYKKIRAYFKNQRQAPRHSKPKI